MNSSLKTVGVIPARLASKRFPGKVLQKINGKPMICHVYERARQCQSLTDLLVATEDSEIYEYCRGEHIPVMMTGRHKTGTDRVNEIMEKTDADIYVNIQGDEPTLRPKHIALLAESFQHHNCPVVTLKVEINDTIAMDPNIVKVVTTSDNYALKFSRSPMVDQCRIDSVARQYKHIGLYAFTRNSLAAFCRMSQSPGELSENLEQMRFLDNDIPVLVLESPHDTISVDTPDDLRKAIAFMCQDR